MTSPDSANDHASQPVDRTQQRFEHLFEASPDATLVHQNERIVFANRSLVRLLGGSDGTDIVGKPPAVFIRPGGPADVRPFPHNQEHHGSRIGPTVEQLRRLDGRLVIVEATAAACEWDAHPAILVHFRDLGERSEAEKRLAESERRFRFLAESIPHFVWSARADGHSDYGNSPFLTYLGKSLSEMQTLDWTLGLHPDDHERAYQAWIQAVATGTEYRTELRIRRASDGQYRWFQAHALPLRNEDDEIVHWYGTCTDIHERKEAEQQVQHLQNVLRGIFDHAPVAIWVKDTARRYVMINAQMRQIVGLTEAEILGKSNEDLDVEGETLRITREQDETVLRTGRARLYEASGPIYGTVRTLLSSKFPLLTADGTVYAVGAVVLDITEHKQLERQYLQAQKMEGMGRLAGGIAHDFNNLLSIILGYAEMVQMELGEDHPSHGSVRHIENAATRAANLTRQLLAFSRRQATDLQILNLSDHLHDMLSMLRPLISASVALDLSLAPDPGFVRADAGQIEQVVVNLVVNARDAMPDGGTLRIETAHATLMEPTFHDVPIRSGDYVLLKITDTGIGMAEEVQSHVFEPFYTTKEMGKGTGLGMATCYGIVKQHKGYIWIDSAPGQGTTVEVYLPRIDAAPADAPAPDGTSAVIGGTETVLVAEDEEMLRHLAVHVLRTHGYTVIEAADGVAALQAASAYDRPIDVLLADLVMPNMGGRELVPWFRELHPEARILFMSGYGTENDEAGPGAAEPGPLIRKPYAASELLKRVRDVLTPS